MQLGEEANGRTLDLTIGATVELDLPENRSAGYQWTLTSPAHPMVTVERDSYQAPTGPPGKPGIHTWVLRAVAPGKAHFELAYRRSWEGGQPPAQTFSVTLRVAPHGNKP